MEQKPCIFCGIINKQIASKIVYEDENSVAVLDINPRSKGMTIVISKQHYKDFSENFDLSEKVFSSALIVSEMIKKTLEPKSISLAIMPSQVPHFHIRIYPFYEDEIPIVENQPKKVSEQELEEVAEKIRAAKVEVKKPEIKEKEEKPKERERGKEEIYWIRRGLEIA